VRICKKKWLNNQEKPLKIATQTKISLLKLKIILNQHVMELGTVSSGEILDRLLLLSKISIYIFILDKLLSCSGKQDEKINKLDFNT